MKPIDQWKSRTARRLGVVAICLLFLVVYPLIMVGSTACLFVLAVLGGLLEFGETMWGYVRDVAHGTRNAVSKFTDAVRSAWAI